MLKFCIIAAVLVASCHGEEQIKELWKRNDRIVEVIDILYDNLAHTVADSSNKQKRSFSIMVAEIFQCISNNENNTAPIDLSCPADIIAADYRGQMDVFKSVLAPAVNAVKRACPPEASAEQCAKALAEEEKGETAKCPEFAEHMKFRKVTEELIDCKEYGEWLCALQKESQKGDDKLALKFVKEMKEGKTYKEVSQKLKEWFKAYATGNFPCNLPPLKENTSTQQCNCTKPPPSAPEPSKEKKNKKKHGFLNINHLTANTNYRSYE